VMQVVVCDSVPDLLLMLPCVGDLLDILLCGRVRVVFDGLRLACLFVATHRFFKVIRFSL
jgi:hypothetical protein